MPLGAGREGDGAAGRVGEGCESTNIEGTARTDQLRPRNWPTSKAPKLESGDMAGDSVV